MKLLIDWSVLCHIAWHKMSSPNYEARTNIEQAEFARNLAGSLVYFFDRFKPSEIIFALDGKSYWRKEVYGKHYAQHARVYRVMAQTEEGPREVHYLCYDT